MSKLFFSYTSSVKKPLFEDWSFSKKNYILFIIGLACIVIGYFTMAQGPENVDSFKSLYLAPILLFCGYIIFIPLSLIYKSKSKEMGS